MKKAEKFLWKNEIERDFIKLKKESIHRGRNTSVPGFGGWRSVYINHRLEQEEHPGGIVSSTGQEGEVPGMLGKEA